MTDAATPKPILIAGPTASGKSALALALAEPLDGEIVNADALQVYAEFRILTARPSLEEEARAPHRLYGHVAAADDRYSTGRWLRETTAALDEIAARGRRPIIIGGTGLYFKALTEGLAEIPATPPEIRAAAEARLERIGAAAFVEELRQRDPESAARIDLANPRRVLRAIEVLETTGLGFAAWLDRTPPPLLPLATSHAIRLLPERDKLRARIALRFQQMIGAGALEEVRAVAALEAAGAIPPAAPALKALGYAPLKAHLAGETMLDAAIEQGVIDTNQYAKRQSTWLRNQMSDWAAVDPLDPASVDALLGEFEA